MYMYVCILCICMCAVELCKYYYLGEAERVGGSALTSADFTAAFVN